MMSNFLKYVGIIVVSLAFQGCSSSTLYYEAPLSDSSLIGISDLYIDEFKGQNSELLKTILIQEVHKVPLFEHLERYPERLSESAIVSGEVLVYSKRDQEEQRDAEKVVLVQRDRWKRHTSRGKRMRQTTFDFVNAPYSERSIHRTLDLEVRFQIRFPKTAKVIYDNVEKVSFQQSYIGEEQIALMPLAEDEMERLGHLLMQRFIEKINPAIIYKELELQTGLVRLPIIPSISFQHPKIKKGNEYAVRGHYEQAAKAWNYLLFEPKVFESSERFNFNNNLYEQLRIEKIPNTIIESLLKLYGKTLGLSETNVALKRILTESHFQTFEAVIKKHARRSKQEDILNMAAAHYNLGALYYLQGELKLASYHLSKANAYRPNERYAQMWTDIQHELGGYNPLGAMSIKNIQAASVVEPPKDAKIQPITAIERRIGKTPQRRSYPAIQPMELPSLDSAQRR